MADSLEISDAVVYQLLNLKEENDVNDEIVVDTFNTLRDWITDMMATLTLAKQLVSE